MEQLPEEDNKSIRYSKLEQIFYILVFIFISILSISIVLPLYLISKLFKLLKFAPQIRQAQVSHNTQPEQNEDSDRL